MLSDKRPDFIFKIYNLSGRKKIPSSDLALVVATDTDSLKSGSDHVDGKRASSSSRHAHSKRCRYFNRKQEATEDGTCTGSSPGEPHNVGSTAIHLLI